MTNYETLPVSPELTQTMSMVSQAHTPNELLGTPDHAGASNSLLGVAVAVVGTWACYRMAKSTTKSNSRVKQGGFRFGDKPDEKPTDHPY